MGQFSSEQSYPAFGTIFSITDGYGTTFRDTDGYMKAGVASSLKRVTMEGISLLVSNFIEASRNFNFGFPSQKDNLKL
jgi:hypothetical protein